MILLMVFAIFGISLWLGFYLIARNPSKRQLVFAGLGLVAYSAALGFDLLGVYAPTPEQGLPFIRIRWIVLTLPVLFWAQAIIGMLPDDIDLPLTTISRLWNIGLFGLAALFYIPGVAGNLIFAPTAGTLQPGPFYTVYMIVVVLFLFSGVGFVLYAHWRGKMRLPVGVLLVMATMFGISAGLLAIPSNIIPGVYLVVGIGFDIILLGLAVALFDAFEEGETLRRDLFRSFLGTLVITVLFASQVAVAMQVALGTTQITIALLLGVITAAVAFQTLADPIQSFFDQVVFGTRSGISQVRSDLRSTAQSVARVDRGVSFVDIEDKEFARLTRRAFSYYGDLTKLAASPLTQLPLIEERLEERGTSADTLERAIELKAVLAESVERLKPRDQGEFGTSNEWRYYNALYFPYIVGLKPYSRRPLQADELAPEEKHALEWFQHTVPERTLYNWQSAAAKLVAQDLRESHISN